MHRFDRHRRRFLGAAGATAAATTLLPAALGPLASSTAAASAQRARVVNRSLPAAAAGTFWLGGDLEIARMGFGAMRITGEGIWGEPKDQREARAVLRRLLELGVNFIDTADAYGPMVSERLIAEALHPYPHGLVIATKGGFTRQGPNKWTPDGRPEHLREACEASLRRLKLERIDLYQLHFPDPKVPYEDSVGTLVQLQREGKIRHIGVSNVDAGQLARARALATVVSVQNRYNVADRSSEEVLRICEKDGIGFIPWGPLAQRAQAADSPPVPMVALQAIAQQRRISVAQAGLAWLLARSPVMLPIPGTSSQGHLEENVAAARIRLTAKELQSVG
ncbi:MAG: aldo/keto reductase [Steroidobacteraceae bacterium]